MSGRLVGEVVEWLRTPAADGLTQAERVVLFVVADRANEQDRVMWRHRTDTESLHERIRGALGVDAKSLGNIFGRLAKRGLEVRIPTGTDKRGKPTFANNGHNTRFRLPEFPASVSLPPAQSSIEEWTFPVDNTPDQPVDNTPEGEGKVHQPMDLHSGRPINGWTFEGERSINGWTVYPSKENPSKTHPSSPGVPSTQPDVEGRPPTHSEPSATKIDSATYRQSPLVAVVPDDATAPDEYETARDLLAVLPDFGQSLIDAARAELGATTPRAQLVIRAARLARRTA
jgi:hypothetical protein